MFRGMELNEMTQIQMEGYQAFYNAAWRHNNPYPEDTQRSFHPQFLKLHISDRQSSS